MPALRFIVIVLVLLNLLVFAGWQGWLEPRVPRGEPERVTNQLRPERIELLDEADLAARLAARPSPVEEVAPPPPAPVAPTPPADEAVVDSAAPPACVAFAGLADAPAQELLADARAQGGFDVRDVPSVDVASWWVHLPSLGSRQAAERRAAELRGQGVTDLYVVTADGDTPFAISLGLFKSAASAAEARRRLESRGVQGVAIEERGPVTHRVEVRGPADSLTLWASEVAGRPGAGDRLDCRP